MNIELKKSVFVTGFFIANFGKYEPCNNYAGYFFFEPLKAYFFATLKFIERKNKQGN
nr:MAG TPA: hypothetical protein [Bacteriophage sp.]